jgi:hypothetical protein
MISKERIVSATLAAAIVGAAAFAAVPALAASVNVSAVGNTTSVNVDIPGVGVHVDAGGSSQSKATSTAGLAGQINAATVQINNRIKSLQNLSSRIQDAKNINAADKTSIQSEINGEISVLNSMVSNLTNATSSASVRAGLREDIQSTRVYALVVPQTSILAAVDRVQNLVTTLSAVGSKVEVRLASSTTATSTSVKTAMQDFNAKLADASSKAGAASAEVVSLKPDNGVKATAEANSTALKDARTKIQAASKDIVAASTDLKTVLRGLGIPRNVLENVSASSTVSVSSH